MGLTIHISEEAKPEREEVLAAITSILAIKTRVKPDPEGWTVRDYVDYGRR